MAARFVYGNVSFALEIRFALMSLTSNWKCKKKEKSKKYEKEGIENV